jgi:hypothetical protein
MRPRGRDMIILLIISFFDMIWSNFKKLLDIKAKLLYNMYYNGRMYRLRNGAVLHLGALPIGAVLYLGAAAIGAVLHLRRRLAPFLQA